MAEKLALEACLQGHQGCVNRLAWNEDGSLLASASDDCQVSQADSPG
jgi:WD and tetratricopeptide repeat-containing protein 1